MGDYEPSELIRCGNCEELVPDTYVSVVCEAEAGCDRTFCDTYCEADHNCDGENDDRPGVIYSG